MENLKFLKAIHGSYTRGIIMYLISRIFRFIAWCRGIRIVTITTQLEDYKRIKR